MTTYHFPMFERLHPRTEWRGGRIADTDILTLSEAASYASRHAGEAVTQADFLRAAARGEIPLRAIIRRQAETRPCRPDIRPFNGGAPIPAGAIPTLPVSACRALAASGRASWRTFESYEEHDGTLMRYTAWELADGEPDFETAPDDCRVLGYECHAVADAFLSEVAAQPVANVSDAGNIPVAGRMTPPDNWSRGVKFVAWEKANAIIERGDALTKNALAEAMGKDSRIEVANNHLSCAIDSASFKNGEDSVKENTLSNWVTQLKRIIATQSR